MKEKWTTEELKSLDWRDINVMKYDDMLNAYRQAASRANLLVGNLRKYADKSPALAFVDREMDGSFRWGDLEGPKDINELRRRMNNVVHFLNLKTNTSKKFRDVQEKKRKRVFGEDSDEDFDKDVWDDYWTYFAILEEMCPDASAWHNKNQDSDPVKLALVAFFRDRPINMKKDKKELYNDFVDYVHTNDYLWESEKLRQWFPREVENEDGEKEDIFKKFAREDGPDAGNGPGEKFDIDAALADIKNIELPF